VCYPIWRGSDRDEALAAIGRLTEIGGGLEPDFDHLLTIYTATDPDLPFDFDRALSLDTSEVAHCTVDLLWLATGSGTGSADSAQARRRDPDDQWRQHQR